jgi:hypothetical protein
LRPPYQVLVAFFATALATVVAIIFGYLSKSFPESYLNDLDRFAIKAFKRSRLFQGILWISKVWRTLTDRLKSCLGLKVETSRPSLPLEVRQEALCRFILTLSDQQLVTGLAILIGAVANQRILSVYEFSVVLSLAWFSSTTHLATLNALRKYFLEHGIVRNWRVGGMLVLLVLLSYSLVVVMFSQTALSPTVPVQCFFSLQPSLLAKQDGVGLINVLIIASTIMTLLIILPSYATAIRDLYNWSYKPSVTTRLAWRLVKLSNSNAKMPPTLNFVEVSAEVQSSKRHERLTQIMKASIHSKWRAKWIATSYEYDDSFLSSMPDIAFSFSYGVTQVVSFRWIYASLDGLSLSSTASAIDFGQITPLFLLVLPVLAAAEIYYGKDLQQIVEASELKINRISRS